MRTLRPGMVGSDVEELQSTLRILGYNTGVIDGSYGPQTRQAVTQFQRDFGLNPDGIFGPATFRVMEKYLLGYNVYTVQPGDTLYKIAARYGTTVQKIQTANPDLNPFLLQIGEEIVVPFGMDVVQTDISYSYEIMERDIAGLQARYPFLRVDAIGKSVQGRNLYRIRLGDGPRQVTYNASHHANEWITTPLLMKWIENISEAYAKKGRLGGYDVQNIWNQATIHLIPMVNPDGVELVLNGISPDAPNYEQIIRWNRGSTNFDGWRSNIRGVDLNRNYDASWEEYKAIEDTFGVEGPGPYGYAGPAAESELETQAMVQFTRDHDFRLTLAYHSQGEVIFWTYKGLEPPEARRIGDLFAQVSGYTLAEPVLYASYAGYKDWFIEEFRRPGYTMEVGLGVNPLPITQLPRIYEQNEEVLILAALV